MNLEKDGKMANAGKDVIKGSESARLRREAGELAEAAKDDAIETRHKRAEEARAEIEGDLGEHYKAVVAVAAKQAKLKRNEKGEVTTVIIRETEGFRGEVLSSFAEKGLDRSKLTNPQARGVVSAVFAKLRCSDQEITLPQKNWSRGGEDLEASMQVAVFLRICTLCDVKASGLEDLRERNAQRGK